MRHATEITICYCMISPTCSVWHKDCVEESARDSVKTQAAILPRCKQSPQARRVMHPACFALQPPLVTQHYNDAPRAPAAYSTGA